jgi:hypothetical protein
MSPPATFELALFQIQNTLQVFMHYCFSQRLCHATHSIFLDNACVVGRYQICSHFSLYIFLGKLCTPQDPYFEGFRYPCEIAYCTRHVTVTLKRTVAAYYGPFSVHLY